MSCYNWEAGTIRLPSAEVANVKAALRVVQNQIRDEVKADCIRIWTDVLKKTRSTKVYLERLRAYQYSEDRRTGDGYSRYGYQQVKRVRQEVWWILQDLAKTPRQVQEKDLDAYYPKATNRTTEFRAGGEATVTFEGSNVRWQVYENNRAVEHAREHPIGQAFFAALAKVNWTRGSGGEIVGNDEYNRDADYAGGGGNYVTATFGPQKKSSPANRYRRIA